MPFQLVITPPSSAACHQSILAMYPDLEPTFQFTMSDGTYYYLSSDFNAIAYKWLVSLHPSFGQEFLAQHPASGKLTDAGIVFTMIMSDIHLQTATEFADALHNIGVPAEITTA